MGKTMTNHNNTQLNEAPERVFVKACHPASPNHNCTWSISKTPEDSVEYIRADLSRASVAAPRDTVRDNLQAIIVRCTDGDPSYDWRTIIARLAQEALDSSPSPVSPSLKEAASNVEQIEVNAIEARAYSSPLLSAETYMFDVRRLLRIHQKYRADLQAVYLRGVSDFHGKIVNALRDLKETYIPTNRALEIIDAAALRTDLPSLKVEEVAAGEQSFQDRVQPWMLECFGAEIAADKEERNHRFLEEALELVQSCGATRSEAHQLVDYTFDRPVGTAQQEVGGVMVTLAALCLAQGFDMHACGEAELTRIWGKVETIRAKQAAKPKHSPLPEHTASTPVTPSDAARKAAEEIARTITHTEFDWAWLSLNRGDEKASEVSKRVAPSLGGEVLDRMSAIISRYLPVPVEEGDERK